VDARRHGVRVVENGILPEAFAAWRQFLPKRSIYKNYLKKVPEK
jgi:hypothetical protein